MEDNIISDEYIIGYSDDIMIELYETELYE
jgi:hypothetical protein